MRAKSNSEYLFLDRSVSIENRGRCIDNIDFQRNKEFLEELLSKLRFSLIFHKHVRIAEIDGFARAGKVIKLLCTSVGKKIGEEKKETHY